MQQPHKVSTAITQDQENGVERSVVDGHDAVVCPTVDDGHDAVVCPTVDDGHDVIVCPTVDDDSAMTEAIKLVSVEAKMAASITDNNRTETKTVVDVVDDDNNQDSDEMTNTAVIDNTNGKESKAVAFGNDEIVDDEKVGLGFGDEVDLAELVEPTVSTDRNDNHMKTNVAEESNGEEPDIGNNKDLDGRGRNKLFQCGVQYDQSGKKKSALKCYLGCIDGLKADTGFTLLPQCLRNIADIYYEQEDYPHAVHFVQAEKLFYENALINTAELRSHLEKTTEADMGNSTEAGSVREETLRAEEYEGLAHLCVDKQQQQLALEYAGKAAKIWQKMYGDNHPTTRQSLDFFTSVYAEVGKQQYSDSMRRLSRPSNGEHTPDCGESERQPAEKEEASPYGTKTPQEPVSILRRRKTSPDVVEKDDKRVRFDDSQIQHLDRKEEEDQIATWFLWLLFITCVLVLLVLGFYIMCRLNSTSGVCQRFKSDLQYTYMRMKYWYYQMYRNSASRKYV